MDSPAENASSDDYYSVFLFRFWRSLALVVHGVFLHYLFRALLDLGGPGCVCFVAALSLPISAATLGVYYWNARILCFVEWRLALGALHTVSTMVIHELIVRQLKGNPQVLVLLPLQTLCFVCYLRSVVTRRDPLQTFFLLHWMSIRNAVWFYMTDGLSSVSVCFFAAGFLQNLARYVNRGFRAPNAGLFDRFLDFLG